MHRIPKVVFIFLIMVVDVQSQQQRIGEWKSFTDMKSVRKAILIGKSIWAATGGGVFAFDTSSGQFTKFTNVDGLDTNDVRTIAYDSSNNIWIGGAGGWVNIYDMNTQHWQIIKDIAAKKEYTNRGIQSFIFKGDTVFIVTEFGISVFRISRWEFGDTYSNFGSLLSPQVSCFAIQQNRMWVGTAAGLATALLSAPNSWINYTSSTGLPSNLITSLTVFNDTLMIGTSNGVAYFASDDTVPRAVASLIGRYIRQLQVDRGRVLVLSMSGLNFTVESLASVHDPPTIIASNSNVQGVCIIPASSLWFATASKGLAHMSASGWEYLYPDGPNSNFFNSVVVDANGVLWGAPGEIMPAGFYRYNPALPDNVQWKSFIGERNLFMNRGGQPFDKYHKVSLGTNGSVWASSWGDGMVEIVADTIRRKLDYYSTPGLPGAVADDPDYVVSGGVAVDNEGKTWIVNRNEVTGRSLLRLDSDSTATFYLNKKNSNYGRFHDVAIDRYGTKWMTNTVPWHIINDPSTGLYYFNENGLIPGTQSNSGWGNISGMSSDLVLSCTVDLEGQVWAGLGLGVVIIPDPLYPNLRSTSFPLREQTVQSIAVDAVNNKWIGTKEGVFVVNTDGTELLRTYTVASTNKRLLANDVRTIAIDQKLGIVYFGTEQGLSSLSIEAIQTNRSYSKLEVGPNPFVLPSDQPLIIRNLIANSTIKILTVSGTVVTQFEAQGGGRGFWDGRDKNGMFVPSGIYFIVAFAENGSQVTTGKVAIIRR